MIALGVTWGGARMPEPLRAVPAGDVTIVAVGQAHPSSARDMLLLQIDAMEGVSAFLPFAPGLECSVERAVTWAKLHGEDVSAALSRVEGACQMVLDLRGKVAESGQPRTWLRQRAELVLMPERVRDGLAPFSRATGVRRSGTGAAIDLLVDRSRIGELRQAVVAVCGGLDSTCWTGTLVGPWPAMGFHGLEVLP